MHVSVTVAEPLRPLTVIVGVLEVSSTNPWMTSESSINPVGEIPNPIHPPVATRTAKAIELPDEDQYSSYRGLLSSKR